MKPLTSSTINEWVKLTARKKTVFFLALITLLPFLVLPIVLRVQSGLGIAGLDGAEYPVTILNLMTLFVLPLMTFMSVSDSFSGEFGDRTIRAVLLRPVSRFKIFTSKLLSVFLLIVGGLALGLASSSIAAIFLPATGDRMAGFADAALAYAAAAIPLFALCTVAVFIATWFKNATGALAIMILVYAAAKLTAFFFPDLTAFSPTAYTDWHRIWIGSSVSVGQISTIFSFLLGCGIVFYTMGFYLFDKKEV